MRIPAKIVVLLVLTGSGCAMSGEDEVESSAWAVANPDGTVVCHHDREIAVAFSAVPAHLAHGDFLGPCVAAEAAVGSVLVCHASGDDLREIQIAFPAVPAHLAHGDFLGPCEAP